MQNVSNNLTEWFPIECGVWQGGILSLTIFGIFIHDLISEVKQLGYGVEFNDEKLSILVNADNIAVLGKTEVDLHNILDLEI